MNKAEPTTSRRVGGGKAEDRKMGQELKQYRAGEMRR